MTIHKEFNLKDEIDRLYVFKKKKEEEDSPALRIAQIYRYKDSSII